MICEHCKKEFKEPLELYNGEWACPLCRENISVTLKELEVTHENEELFNLSEICYFRAVKAENRKDYQRDLSKAVELCREAARLQHPKALLRMGYYYDAGYIAFDRNEAFKMAHDYYKAVWTATRIDVNYTGGVADDWGANGVKLKERAALLYLNLLKNVPEKYSNNSVYNYSEAKAAVIAAGLPVKLSDEGAENREEDRAVKVLDILESCKTGGRAPLFGVLRVDGETFKRLAEIKDAGKKEKRAKLFKYAVSVDIVMLNEHTGNAKTIRKEEDVAAINDDEQYYLYFFNVGGKQPKAGNFKSAQKVIERETNRGEYGRVLELGDKAKTLGGDFVFYADDVLKYKSKSESFRHATGDLLNAVLK